MFDLHGLPDCAAELLLPRPGLTCEGEREPLLDMLAASAGLGTTFASTIAGSRATLKAKRLLGV